MSVHYDKTDKDFAEYIKGLVLDLRESRRDATADDFDEAIARLNRANKVLDALWDVCRDQFLSFDARQRETVNILRATKDHKGIK